MKLDGRTALVTGGSRGIGKAIAHRLAREGAHVTIVGRTASSVEATLAEMSAGGLSCAGVVGDVTEPSDIERIVDTVVAQHGTIDILCNNAAAADSAPFLEMTRDQWERILHTNLTSPFLMAQAAARHMVGQRRGVIVNISSISAHGADSMPNYSAAKAGLHSLTRDIATELAPLGVRCVTVTPGWVETELVAESMTPEMLETLRHNFQRVPMKRLLHVEEVAGIVAMVASDDASGVTGSEVVVDGGTLADLHVNATFRS
ncbi:SDR family NAD(P)-dependent oxidoreductase (plasmid) [Rhodococcus opacus]|uniref:SDR family NAD(P)-dependent oxidoreductase n=1 Tax=Rhodococcus opacus TaxID=37919 RepID=UPI0034D1FA71